MVVPGLSAYSRRNVSALKRNETIMNRDLSIRLREARNDVGSHRLHLAASGAAAPRAVPAASSAIPQEHPLLREREPSRRRGPEVLSRPQFLEQMEREKRRAERTRVPFSMVLMEHDEAAAGADVLDLLPGAIAELKRDTDIVGDLDDSMLAVL